jgi:transketolase
LGSAVLSAFAGAGDVPTYEGSQLRLIQLAVRDMPSSGKPAELLHAAKIDANAIVAAARSLVKQPIEA